MGSLATAKGLVNPNPQGGLPARHLNYPKPFRRTKASAFKGTGSRPSDARHADALSVLCMLKRYNIP
jgi:hypothetical protein